MYMSTASICRINFFRGLGKVSRCAPQSIARRSPQNDSDPSETEIFRDTFFLHTQHESRYKIPDACRASSTENWCGLDRRLRFSDAERRDLIPSGTRSRDGKTEQKVHTTQPMKVKDVVPGRGRRWPVEVVVRCVLHSRELRLVAGASKNTNNIQITYKSQIPNPKLLCRQRPGKCASRCHLVPLAGGG